jgi:hypothetical protein
MKIVGEFSFKFRLTMATSGGSQIVNTQFVGKFKFLTKNCNNINILLFKYLFHQLMSEN